MLSGCRKFCDNHFFFQFPFLEDSIIMFSNGFYITVKQQSHLMTI